MKTRNSIFFLLLISIPAVAELPISLPDQKTREVVEYLDAKVTKAQLDVNRGVSGLQLVSNDCGSASTCTATCPGSKKATGGGCDYVVNVFGKGVPLASSFYCQISNTQQLTAYVICANAQ